MKRKRLSDADKEAAYSRAVCRWLLQHLRENIRTWFPDCDDAQIASLTAYAERGLSAIAEGKDPFLAARAA